MQLTEGNRSWDLLCRIHSIGIIQLNFVLFLLSLFRILLNVVEYCFWNHLSEWQLDFARIVSVCQIIEIRFYQKKFVEVLEITGLEFVINILAPILKPNFTFCIKAEGKIGFSFVFLYVFNQVSFQVSIWKCISLYFFLFRMPNQPILNLNLFYFTVHK